LWTELEPACNEYSSANHIVGIALEKGGDQERDAFNANVVTVFSVPPEAYRLRPGRYVLQVKQYACSVYWTASLEHEIFLRRRMNVEVSRVIKQVFS
jgi:hypothetical protein